MSKFLVGWSEVSITPDKKIALAGQFFERISQYVETPITVTAMAVESAGEQLIICSCDLVGIGEYAIEEIRRKVAAKNSEIDTKKIIINVTHTHTSHVLETGVSTLATAKTVLNRFLPEEKQYEVKVSAKGDDFMDGAEAFGFVTDRAAEAVVKAWENRKSAKYAGGFGRAAVGMCRRVCYDDGSAKMWGDTNKASFTELEGGNDSGIELMFMFDENEKLTGIVANIACPSQVVEHRSFISSDYWGKVKILLREKFGEDIYVLCLCAPAGDQCPRDLVRWVNPETPIDDPNIERNDYIERNADPSMFDIAGTWKVGKRIANEIFMAYEEIGALQDDIVLEHKVIDLDLPIRRVTPAEYEAAVAKLEEYAAKVEGRVNFADNAKMHIYSGTVLRYEQQHTQNLVPIELHVARFGDFAFATNPFELFLDFGNQMRARSRAKQTILIQLSCGSLGYLPTEKAEKGSHYSAYISSGNVGHEGGDLLVRKTLEEINKMW